MLLSVAPVPALEVNVPLAAPRGSTCALCASPPSATLQTCVCLSDANPRVLAPDVGLASVSLRNA